MNIVEKITSANSKLINVYNQIGRQNIFFYPNMKVKHQTLKKLLYRKIYFLFKIWHFLIVKIPIIFLKFIFNSKGLFSKTPCLQYKFQLYSLFIQFKIIKHGFYTFSEIIYQTYPISTYCRSSKNVASIKKKNNCCNNRCVT